MAAQCGRRLKDEEIALALSDSDIGEGSDLEDNNEINEPIDHTSNRRENESSSSSSSEDDIPLSELVRSQPRTGIGRIRGTSRGSRRGLSTRDSRGRSLRGRHGGSRGRGSSRNVEIPDQVEDFEEPRTWTHTDFTPKEILLFQPAYLNVDSSQFNSKLDYLQQYLDDPLIKLIVEKSNQTFVKTTGKSLYLTESELCVYIGIMLVMGAIGLPRLRMYWEKKYRVPAIADIMARNRFFLLRNSIKFVFDDEVGREQRDKDKVWKIRPLLDTILKACKLQPKDQDLSIDEMIIPFSGQCGIRQYVPGKPNPTGLKVFVLANRNGIVCNFDVYQGGTTYPKYDNANLGLREKVVLNLVDDFLAPGHKLYFDRYFTTPKLAQELKDRGILCAGTIMKKRVPVAARQMIKDDREMKREGRGSCQVLVKTSENMAITKWYDNKGVTMLSTIYAKEPMDTCSRWRKSHRDYIQVERPKVVQAYNSNMGGVDLADRMLALCPNRYRTKKWTQRVFAHLVDLAVSNAWLLYKKDELAKQIPAKKIQQLRDFKLKLGEIWIDKYTNVSQSEQEEEEDDREPKRKRGRPGTMELPAPNKRTKGALHMPEMVDTRNKCRHCHKMKTTVKCTQCNIYLCFRKERNCFKNFHS